MGLPAVTQTYITSFNNRSTPYVSLVSTMGDVMFSKVSFLATTVGFTVRGSSNGTTGAMDGANRITSNAAWATRNNGASGAMSWIVLRDAMGVDWCWSYNSSSDDVVRLSHSTGGNFVAAGTPNQQPTAIDESFDAASGTWIDPTTSDDRVWHMWASTDKKMWRIVVARQGVVASYIAGEKFTPAIIAPTTATLSTGGGTAAVIKSYYNSLSTATQTGEIAYSVSSLSDLCRLHVSGSDQDTKCCWGGETIAQASQGQLSTDKPPLQGGTGELIFPMNMGSTASAAFMGKLGNRIDCWYVMGPPTKPLLGDNYGVHVLEVMAQSLILPGDLATVLVYT